MSCSPILSPVTIRCKQALDWFRGWPDEHASERHILFICKPCIKAVDFLVQLIDLFPQAPSSVIWHVYVEKCILSYDSYRQLMDRLSAVKNVILSVWPTIESVTGEMASLSRLPPIDMMISLGGDGTVLHAAWQFQGKPVPPLLPVYVYGTLGFLTAFDMPACHDFVQFLLQPSLHSLSCPLCCHQRMRLRCCIVRNEKNVETETFHVLNEVVIDRGPSPYMTQLHVFGDDRLLTTSHSDGLIIATPTGSTAYSMSAGGSIVDPAIPAILLTPICPHTLSFRPIHVRDSMVIKIVIPKETSCAAWASFDGRHRVELVAGDCIVVSVSNYPVPTLCNSDQTQEWFSSLSRCLGWNERGRGYYTPFSSS